MAKNLIPEICKMLGVEVGEEFKIRDRQGKDNGKYCIDENGALLYLSLKKPIPHLMGIKALLNGELEIVKLPWKPKKYEKYFCFVIDLGNGKMYVDLKIWCNSIFDNACYKAGWVYRTKEEAEATLPKVAEELGVKYEI